MTQELEIKLKDLLQPIDEETLKSILSDIDYEIQEKESNKGKVLTYNDGDVAIWEKIELVDGDPDARAERLMRIIESR